MPYKLKILVNGQHFTKTCNNKKAAIEHCFRIGSSGFFTEDNHYYYPPSQISRITLAEVK